MHMITHLIGHLAGAVQPLPAMFLALPDVVRSIGAMALVIGVMVLVHEWGHFVIARLFKVRVDTFSIGFGPRLTGWRRGPTDYRISALPLGGYVKMAGDTPEEERTGAPDEFLSKPRWQRALILIAGPSMNVVSAAVIFFLLLYVSGIPESAFYSKPPVLAGVMHNSPAERAGLHEGDLLLEVNHTPTHTWEDVGKAISGSTTKGRAEVVYERGGQKFTATSVADPARREAQGAAYLVGFPDDPIELGSVVSGRPADRAGLKVNDRIVSVDGAPIHYAEQFLDAVRNSGGKALQFTILRNGQSLTIPVEPKLDAPPDGEKAWRIGVMPAPVDMHYKKLTLWESVSLSSEQTVSLTGRIFETVIQLVSGRASIREVEGPVGIMRYSGEAAKRGLYDLLLLTAAISLNLAILNLLPIPILDGGHILLLALEGVRRRDFSSVFRERFLQVGLVFILLLVVIVMYNDIRNLIPARWLS